MSELDDLSPAQIERLKRLAEFTPDQLETLSYIVRKEQSWTFVRSYLNGVAVFFVTIVSATILFWDQIKSLIKGAAQ